MHYKEHCKDCEKALGKAWEVVHRWLDEYAANYWPSMMHRVHRHHQEGVEEVRKLWGDQAAEAAEIHIRADMGSKEVPSKADVNARYNQFY